MIFSGTSVKLEKPLLERVKAAAQAGGYSSVDEFVAHAVERHLSELEKAANDSAEAKAAVLRQLKGLGYLE